MHCFPAQQAEHRECILIPMLNMTQALSYVLMLPHPTFLMQPGGRVQVLNACCVVQLEEAASLEGASAVAGDDRAARISGSCMLAGVARLCEGLSGRAVRKLPFLAHTQLGGAAAARKLGCQLDRFLAALHAAAQLELSDRERMEGNEETA